MIIPLQITFRDMEPSPAVEASIREKAEKLDRFFSRNMSCRVTVESPHRHHHKGSLYEVRIELSVPDGDLVVNQTHHKDHAHEDVYLAIRDSFNALKRQLEDYAAKRRGKVKLHTQQPHGRVLGLIPEEDYGKIETTDGRVLYFHRNSVLGDDYDKLDVGSSVRFVEEAGDEGPQASTVIIEGKHHVGD